MEQNVQQLLQVERDVNNMVQQALKNKRERLAQIRKQVDIEVEQFKQELESEKNDKIQQVSLLAECCEYAQSD